MPNIVDYQLRQMETEDPLWARRWTEAKYSLINDFKAVEDDLATSEAEKKVIAPIQELSSTLLNSEYSPYGCDETVTSLGIKYWGYQPGSTPSLEEMVIQHLPLPLQARFRRFLPWDKPQAVLEKLAELGLLKKDLLAVFRAIEADSLDLAPSLGRDPVYPAKNKPAPLMRVFEMPHSFQSLKDLNLRRAILKDDDIRYLTRLKLVKLNLASTGISTEATAHLVALKDTLQSLDLSNNPKIKHWACYNLAALTDLTCLNLAGTQMRMLSLRYLAEVWRSPKVLDLVVPTTCKLFLQSLADVYHTIIPGPYLAKYDQHRFDEMYVNQVRNNLVFHQQKDQSISLKGSFESQLRTLKKHLKRREADLRLRTWVLKQAEWPDLAEDDDE